MTLSPEELKQVVDALDLQQNAALLELQRQQMAAAWISAVAAAVQAVGAVATIWFSIKLARESIEREALAERRAEERALAEDRAATQRAEEAQRREAERFAKREAVEQAQRNAAYNKSIDTILAHARQLAEHFRSQSEKYESEPRGPTYVFTVGVSTAHPLHVAVAKARIEYDDADVLTALANISQAITERRERVQAPEAAQICAAAAGAIEDAADNLRSNRRPD